MSNLYKLNLKDVAKGLAVAVFAGACLSAITVVQGVLNAPDFDLFAVNWVALGHGMVNAAVIGAEGGFSGYIIKNFFSDRDGKVFGRIG